MTKEEIISKLTNNHSQFIDLIDKLNESDFMFAPATKWTAGQQLDHIFRSVSPLILAFTLPKFMLSMLFGKTNRASKDYPTLVEKYKSKLQTGGVASGRFVPKPIYWNEKEQLKNKLEKTVNKLCKRVENCSEQDLDTYVLPHPLLGKLTLREMLFFTIHHVEHHQELTILYLHQKNK